MRADRYNILMAGEEVLALRAAIYMGAFAERQATLRAIIANQTRQGYGQQADAAERELQMLERAAETLMTMKPEGAS